MDLDPRALALNLVANNAAAQAGQTAPLRIVRQQTLAPLEVNGHKYLRLHDLGVNASSFTSVYLVASQRDTGDTDLHGRGRRRELVVKQIGPIKEEALLDNAQRELDILNKLKEREHASSHIIGLVDSEWKESSEGRRQLSLVLEYGGGGTLDDWGSAAHRSPLALLAVAEQVIACIGWLHAQGVVHLDVKPANFVFFQQGKLKLIDMGVARDLPLSERITLAEPFPGSINFIAPEAIMGEPYSLSAKTDIWAVGCLLYALVAGSTPFPKNPGKNLQAQRAVLASGTVETHLAGADDLLRASELGAVCVDLFCSCMHVDPAQRASAVELVQHPALKFEGAR